MAPAPPSLTPGQADSAFRAAIKRVTAACRTLVLALLDDADMSDEQVSLLYTSAVKAFFETMDEYERLGVAPSHLDDLRSFPDALRDEIENVFAQMYDHNHPGNATSPADDLTVSGEEINRLIARLIKSLQEKARVHLAGMAAAAAAAAAASASVGASAPSATTSPLSPQPPLLQPPSAAPPQPHPNAPLPPLPPPSQPLSATPPTSRNYIDNFGRRRSSATGGSTTRRASRSSSPSRTRTNTAPSVGSDDHSGPITKLYLQVGHEVKRVRYPKPTLDVPTIRSLFVSKFQLIPPADPDHFPKVYLQDSNSPHIFFEMDDLSDVRDGSLLQLQLPPDSVATSPLAHTHAPLLPLPGVPKGPAGITMLQQKLAEVRTLRRELFQLRNSVQDQAVEMHAVIVGVGDQVRAVLAAQASQPDDDADADAADPQATAEGSIASRKVLEHTKSALSVATAGLSDRVLDLDDLVEGIRRDMVSRGAVPSKATLDYAATELEELHRAVELACSQVEQIRPAWKTVWEQDLRRVVTEQELLDRAESSLDEATQRLEAVAKLTHQLNRVVAIASTNPSAVIPRPRKFDPNAAAVAAEGTEGFEGLQTVLAELSAVLDAETAAAVSERRLRAARRIEKLKQWEREHRRDDFSWELRQFAGVTAATDDSPTSAASTETVKPRKLRSTGGVEALERARAAKEREVLAAVYQHAKEVKAKQSLPQMAQ